MNTTPNWDDLRHEHDAETIGPLWLAEVARTVRRVADRYPPAVYSETGHWNEAALENLTQDVVLTQLLDEGQLDYILTVANSLDAARALLTRTVKRTLSRGRRRTVIDNLLDRANGIAPFAAADHPGPQATDVALLAAANQMARLRRVRIINSDRAPIVYTADNLRKVIQIATDTIGANIRRRELERIFELVLADYLPSALIQFEGGLDEPNRAFTPEEELTVQEATHHLSNLPTDALTILALKIADHSDSEVARHFDISRPTAAKRFKQASDQVGDAIRELTPAMQDEVLARFADFLLAGHLPHDDDPPGGTR